MKKIISLIVCFSIAVFAQIEMIEQNQQPQQPPPQGQYQQPPPGYQYPPQQGQYQQPPPQEYQYPPPPQQDKVKNFSAGQRWGTFGLNLLIPGLGSYIIMGDIFGGVVQDILAIGGFVLIMNGTDEKTETVGGGDRYCAQYYQTRPGVCAVWRTTPGIEEKTLEYNELYWIGLGAVGLNFIYNIIRSASYDKPAKVAMGREDGFNFAVLPNRRGEYMPYFLYSKAF